MSFTSFMPGARGQCPHCCTIDRFEPAEGRVGKSQMTQVEGRLVGLSEKLEFLWSHCPNCGRLIFSVCAVEIHSAGSQGASISFGEQILLWPMHRSRVAPPPDVPAHVRDDYDEAATILNLSPKSSAALSRRCLQSLLRVQGYNQKDLWQQIDAVLPHLPSYIAKDVDSIRHVGNFAAHPMKSSSSGEIVDVEHGEAEWNLDVLDMLFDFYYTQPALAQQKRDALNAKLVDAGKQPMK
jgi:hypothetical protein